MTLWGKPYWKLKMALPNPLGQMRLQFSRFQFRVLKVDDFWVTNSLETGIQCHHQTSWTHILWTHNNLAAYQQNSQTQTWGIFRKDISMWSMGRLGHNRLIGLGMNYIIDNDSNKEKGIDDDSRIGFADWDLKGLK